MKNDLKKHFTHYEILKKNPLPEILHYIYTANQENGSNWSFIGDCSSDGKDCTNDILICARLMFTGSVPKEGSVVNLILNFIHSGEACIPFYLDVDGYLINEGEM